MEPYRICAEPLTAYKIAFLDRHYFARLAIITLQIPTHAIICTLHPIKKRSNVAIVTRIQSLSGDDYPIAYSTFDPEFKYECGHIVTPTGDFCTDLCMDAIGLFYLEPSREEQISCQSGIHFFYARTDAVEYARGFAW